MEHVRKSRRMPIGSLHVCAAAAVTPGGVAMVEVVEALLYVAKGSRAAAMASEAAAASATAAESVRVELLRLRRLLQIHPEGAHPQKAGSSAGAIVVLGRAPPRVRYVIARSDDGGV